MSLDVDRIGAVVASAKGTSDELMAIVAGLIPLATQSSYSKVEFDNEDLHIQIGMRGQFARMVDRLNQIESLKLGIAPIVAAVFSTDDSDVLVLKYWAIPGEQRLAIDRAHQPDEAARHRYRDEMLKLAHAGWMHEYGLRGSQTSRIGSRTGTIVLEDWDTLEPIEDKDAIVARLSRVT
jgi:hypothetical protein